MSSPQVSPCKSTEAFADRFCCSRIQAKRLRLAWIHAERVRLAERLKVVENLCEADDESTAPLKKQVEAHVEAMAPSIEKYLEEARKSLHEEKAAAAAEETKGLEPNTSN
ncbi:hypothetical protein FGLOB1_8265, partial [Fusarium globosum]